MRKSSSFIGIIILGLVGWYLLVKPYDYMVKFTARTTPGAINQSLKLWNRGLENNSPIQQDNLHNLEQLIKINDSICSYNWGITPIDDSTSRIKVYVKDLDHSLYNKLTVPFLNTNFKKRTIKTVSEFRKNLNNHIKEFKVKVEGEGDIKATYCAYIPIKGLQIEKARGMMNNYSILSAFLGGNNVKLNGEPFIETTYWNQENDSLHYNFCFPIIKSDSLPFHQLIKYKKIDDSKALKALYNGNYITSDRAWYELINYAEKNNIEIRHTPLEIFYNNPNFGGDPINWKTEVYMPLK